MKNLAFLSLLAAGAMAVPAFAQTAEPSDAPTAKWGPRLALEENGVRPWVSFTGEGWTRMDGMNGGNANLWLMLVDFGFEVDLGKFGGPETGMIVAQARWSETSRDGALGTGSYNNASSYFADEQLRVFNLYYTQSWNNNEFAVKIGQIAADDDFMKSAYSSLFLNSSFGAMPGVFGGRNAFGTTTISYASYPVASPGVWVNWNINEKFSWQNAIYLGGPGPDDRGNHGFDWKSITDTGVLIMTEGAMKFDMAGKPSTLKLGAMLHTEDFQDFDSGNTDSCIYSVYLVHDFAITMNQDKVGLGGFWRLSVSPQEDTATAFVYADAGINWYAPFASRPNDVAGAAISWTKLGGAFKDFEAAAHENEFTLELTYKAQITSYWSVQGDIQYVVNPAYSNDDAWVAGFRTVFDF